MIILENWREASVSTEIGFFNVYKTWSHEKELIYSVKGCNLLLSLAGPPVCRPLVSYRGLFWVLVRELLYEV